MHSSARPSARVRLTSMALAPLVDALLLLPFLLDDPVRRALPVQPLRITGIRLQPLPAPAMEVPSISDAPAIPPRAAAVPPANPVPPAAGPPAPASPAVDWHAQAAEAAARQATAGGGEATTFSPAPQTVRKPCEPRESSFQWNPEQPRAGLLPLPYVRIGERCVVGLGFFSCTLGELPPPNSHLFDDMKAGAGSPSSVPDPNICD